jgi:hypothetical protein|tara:strand:- start:3290 stop:5059 length:1770 start_codon:yes stop_codon:yes gene_type:complete
MPKIPTYTAQGRPTAEVGSLRSNIKLDPTRTMASGLLPAANAIDSYHLKQRDNNEKLEARKTFYEMKAESDKVIEKYKNDPDEFNSVNGYNNDFGNYKKQKLSQIKNSRIKKKLELLLDEDQAENVYKIKNNSFDAFETNSNQTYNDGQNILANEYALAEDVKTKEVKLNQMLDLSKEHGDMHQMGEAWLKEETNKIKSNTELFEVDSALAKKDFTTATNILKQSKSIDNDEVEKRIIKIKEQEGEYNELNYYIGNLVEGKNLMIGADFKFVDEKKVIAETEKRLFNLADQKKLTDEARFATVDEVFAKNGIVSPTYKDLFETGYNTGSTTTFDNPADVPDTLIKAVKAAEMADRTKRLNVYTSAEEERFFKNVIALKQINGFSDFEAIKAAKNFEMNYDANIIKGSGKQKKLTLDDIGSSSKFKETGATNLGEVRGYAGKLYDMYVNLGIKDIKARRQVKKDIDNNVVVVDNHAYLKRDINAFEAIDGVQNVKLYKEIIIKDKLESNEDPDDFYLKHNGGGQFEIRRKVDLSTVIGTDNNPLIFYRKDLLEIKQNRIKDYKSEILQLNDTKQINKEKTVGDLLNIEGA